MQIATFNHWRKRTQTLLAFPMVMKIEDALYVEIGLLGIGFIVRFSL